MTPRRALKSLETLARARELELNELRRQAALAADRLARTSQAIAGLRQAAAAEAATAGDAPDMLAAYAAFAGQIRVRATALEAAREGLIADLDIADARVADGYRNLKQIEQAAEARRREIQEEAARKERAEADDIAGMRAHARRV